MKIVQEMFINTLTNEIREAILSDDIVRYKFNLYQWYQLELHIIHYWNF